MNAEPNPKQTLILWALLAEGGAAAQKGFVPAIDKKDRDALEKAGLLTAEKGKRGAYRLEVTDKGWNWAGEHLGAALPAGRNATKAGTPVLQAWLGRLQAYMRANGVSLAEILTAAAAGVDASGGATEPEGTGTLAEPDRDRNPTAGPEEEAPATDYAALRERIRAAYLDIARGFSKDGVPLSEIRTKLPGIDRDAVDDALRRMHGESGVTLMSLDNPREIEAEREAALRLKGEAVHVLWIKQ